MDEPVPNAKRASAPAADSEEEDDYMSMKITEPAPSKAPETYTQRRLRLQREAEKRAYTPPKSELLKRQAEEREAALQKSILEDAEKKKSKGLAMMAKMGYKSGTALGKKDEEGKVAGRLEPVGISIKEDRAGIGLDTLKRKEFNEKVEHEAKRVKADEGEYRERVRREREEKRLEGLFGSAMRVAERMDAEQDEKEGTTDSVTENGNPRTIRSKPLKQINVLWRGLVKGREEAERDRRMRYDLHQSLSRMPTYADPTEDAEDRRALGKDRIQHTLVEDLEEEDHELDEFFALEPAERLQKIVVYLRETFHYCFWCKYVYPDEKMEGCPGLREEEHD